MRRAPPAGRIVTALAPFQVMASDAHRFLSSSLYSSGTLVAWDPAPFSADLTQVTLRMDAEPWRPSSSSSLCFLKPLPPYSGTTGQTTPSSLSTRDTGCSTPCSPSTSCNLALSGSFGSRYKTTWPSPFRRTRPPPACSVREASTLLPLESSAEVQEIST